ncbi:hypothetical protein ANANG_G00278400 [Anguilla anguilla]|uniref:Uncharacterized protein n=1 Tax=Anguilla anguilla TaxID=7936 RepID=A0A9D3LNN4_ANGAN|nr:hypothetical protein ANANG_G00278400 [Anguilla anguilla]
MYGGRFGPNAFNNSFVLFWISPKHFLFTEKYRCDLTWRWEESRSGEKDHSNKSGRKLETSSWQWREDWTGIRRGVSHRRERRERPQTAAVWCVSGRSQESGRDTNLQHQS